MEMLSEEELQALPEFDDLEAALLQPEKVFRLQLYRHPETPLLGRVSELINLRSLSITLMDVSLLLPHLGRLKHLQKISFQACQIREFPNTLLELPALKSLGMGNNQIKTLPQDFGRLTSLEYLNLSQNELTSLPESFSQLKLLKNVGLSCNALTDLPESIGDLGALESLHLDGNNLTALPEGLGRLAALESLSLNFNKLTRLPTSLKDLSSLRSIQLEHNRFTELPSWLGERPDLEVKIESTKRSLFSDWTYPHSPLPVLKELQSLELWVQPNTPEYESIKTRLVEAGLTNNVDKVLKLTRSALKISTTEADDYSQPGSSRFGGFPDLESPEQYPQTHGQYWSFLAQINLAEIAPLNHWLPRTGLLCFFMDSSERLNGQVLYLEGEPESLATVRHNGGEELMDSTDDYTENAYRLHFESAVSPPMSAQFKELTWKEKERYEDWHMQYVQPQHEMNSYTFTQHESPQEQAADQMRGQPDEWVPLLQLGADDYVGFQFWDAGTITFCIHQEDLRRADFSRIHLSLESS